MANCILSYLVPLLLNAELCSDVLRPKKCVFCGEDDQIVAVNGTRGDAYDLTDASFVQHVAHVVDSAALAFWAYLSLARMRRSSVLKTIFGMIY